MKPAAAAALSLLTGCLVSVAFAAQSSAPPALDRFVVFEHRAGVERAPDPACLSGYARRSHPLYDKYRLLILERRDGSARAEAAALGRCLGADWLRVPFDYSSSALSIPTDEILVRFKTGVRTGEINALFREHALTLEGPADSRTLTAKSHRPIAESFSVLKKLQTSGLVDYAELNKLLIRFDR